MYRKMIYLVFVILALSPAGNASAEIVGYWKFDEGSGTTALDTTGNGNYGTLEGDPTFVDGQFVLALAFDGSRVAIPASDSLTADLFQGPFSLSTWINPTRTGNMWQQIFRSVRGSDNPTETMFNDTLFINIDGRISLRGLVGGSWAGGMCETDPNVVPADQWTHVALTGDGTNFRIYVNGALSKESAFKTTDGMNATYYIGGDPIWPNEFYTGMIDDVRIYNNALSKNEIKAQSQAEIEPWPEGLVYFADPNLKADVEERLGVTDPTINDMLLMTYISPIDRGIRDLTGIEYATNMTVLELYRNEITDISPLSGLTNLTHLNLQRNQISDISPLSGLINLQELDIEGNLVTDLTALSGLNKLTMLRVNSNQIDNVSPLSPLTHLQHLNIEGNYINDISPLSDLTNLNVFGMGNNQINDISPLSSMINLTWLGIQQNNINDISTLSGLTKLMELYLNTNQISDISPLSGLTNLTCLHLQSNPLDWTAYYVDIPLIVVNNPNLLPENFLYDHKIAFDPYPPDGATSMDLNVILSWKPSMTGELHYVYFGDNFDDVNDRTDDTFQGNQTETSFTIGLPGQPYPDGLVPGATYYWRIDELNAEGTVAKGQIWSFTVGGPLEVTAEYQVAASKDDGYATNDSLQNTDSAYLKVGYSSFTQPPYYASGMIFRNVDIPQGAEIVSAHLQIRAYNSRLSDLVYGKIQAEASDNAADFGAFHNIGTLHKTNASINWDLEESWEADTWYTSPDISGVVQEVIDRGGWSEGNTLAIIYSTRQSEGGYRNISSFDRGSDYATVLEITYIP